MDDISDIERSIHACKKCKQEPFGEIIQYYPVVSFGKLTTKPLLVVGLNPSTREYKDGFLSESHNLEDRHMKQINYFRTRKKYTFFAHLMKLFQGEAKRVLGWKRNPWEKVGFTDLVKCPTRWAGGQWTSIKPKSTREKIISNCENHLKQQLRHLNPNIVMAYGADVCRWFYPDYKEQKHRFTALKIELYGKSIPVLLVPQARGSHQPEDIMRIQTKIADIFSKHEGG